MTLRSMYRPSRFDRPLPISRAGLLVCAAVVSWLMIWGLGYLLALLVRGMLP